MQIPLLQVLAPFREERTRKADDLLHAHIRIELFVFCDEPNPAPNFSCMIRIDDDVAAKHLNGATIGPQKAHQRFYCCGLAGAVAAQEPEDAPCGYTQIDAAKYRPPFERL